MWGTRGDVEKKAEFYYVLSTSDSQAPIINYSAKLTVSRLVLYRIFFIVIHFISISYQFVRKAKKLMQSYNDI